MTQDKLENSLAKAMLNTKRASRLLGPLRVGTPIDSKPFWELENVRRIPTKRILR